MIDLLSPAEVVTGSSRIAVRLRVRTPADAPATGLRVRVDGLLQPAPPAGAPGAAGGEQVLEVDVPARDSDVRVFAENQHGVSAPATVHVRWSAGPGTPRSGGAPAGPVLYLLAVGVSRYDDARLRPLAFAAKDAQDFAAAMQRQQGGFYRRVEVRLVTQAEATRDNIVDGLDWLQRQVSSEDVGMLFLAGHGWHAPRLGLSFLPVNAHPDSPRRTAVPLRDITAVLAGLRGRAVALMDIQREAAPLASIPGAVHADLDGLVDSLASPENAVAVLSASGSRELSFEDPGWNNGAFTKALVEGVDGPAAADGAIVTFAALRAYVTRRLAEITGGRQVPAAGTPDGAEALALARALK